MKVLVTGGMGYIGSHTVVELAAAGHEPIIVDNLANSYEDVLGRVEKITGTEIPFENMDLCVKEDVEALFDKYDIDAVIHFAALKAVGESVEKPVEYYSNNLISALNILNAMKTRGINKFVFSSSACVYGQQEVFPIPESAASMDNTENPYGTTKTFIEQILRDYCKADPSMNVAILRYFNPIGAHPSGLIGEHPKGVPANLMPRLADVAIGKVPAITIYGDDYPTKDGTCIRDYIHVVDLAKGHICALEKLSEGIGLLTCNLGTGTGYSVKEIVAAYSKACGRDLPTVITPRRPGDVPASVADPTVANTVMGWYAEKDLDDMCRDAWNWTKQFLD